MRLKQEAEQPRVQSEPEVERPRVQSEPFQKKAKVFVPGHLWLGITRDGVADFIREFEDQQVRELYKSMHQRTREKYQKDLK